MNFKERCGYIRDGQSKIEVYWREVLVSNETVDLLMGVDENLLYRAYTKWGLR